MFFKNISIVCLSISFIWISPILASVDTSEGDFEDLGYPMAGKQMLAPSSSHSGEHTYARVYASGASDFLREELSKAGDGYLGKGYIRVGNAYSFTPYEYRDGRNFGSLYTQCPGGGFFLVHDKLKENERINCFGYALSTFGEKLEELCDQTMDEIRESVRQSIDDYVEKYFECVESPLDGDLVIYQTTKQTQTLNRMQCFPTGTITHAGIYRNSDRNWNSPPGGTVESKWGRCGVYKVYQHDVFFVPHFYGDSVKFYRLKEVIAGS